MKTLIGLLLLISLRAEGGALNFSCRTEERDRTHLVMFEMELNQDGTGRALAVDARGGVNDGHTYNSNWKVLHKELAKAANGVQLLVEMTVEKAKGIGEELNRFQELRLVIDSSSGEGEGGGLSLALNKAQATVTCHRENNPPPRVPELNP